jgi:hypothetical protein
MPATVWQEQSGLSHFCALIALVVGARLQTAAHVKQQGGKLRIAGYYQCNERLDDVDLGIIGRRIADKVEALFPGSAAIVVSRPARLLPRARRARTFACTLRSTLNWLAPRPVLQLDGPALRAALTGGGTQPPVQLLGKDARGWVTAAAAGPGARFTCPAVTATLAQYVQEGRHWRLSDFEDHLEDLQGADWLNPGLCE